MLKIEENKTVDYLSAEEGINMIDFFIKMHNKGVLHKDTKPNNIFIKDDILRLTISELKKDLLLSQKKYKILRIKR